MENAPVSVSPIRLRLECAGWFQREAILSRVLRLLHEQFSQFPNWAPKTGLGDAVGEQVGIWVNFLVTNDYPMAAIFSLFHFMAHKLMKNSVAHQNVLC